MLKHGIDIVYIPRMNNIISKNEILTKLFTDEEINYFKVHNNAIDSIAGIYAAKEAFIKALELSISEINLKDIEVLHKSNGAPYFNFYNELKEKTKHLNISLSISHDHNYAIASVISN